MAPRKTASGATIDRARDLRGSMTLPEVVLWRDLRGDRLGVRFRRQHPIGPYVLDFYCAPHKLAVEVDGAVHDDPRRAARDGERDAWLARHGIRVLRFRAADMLSAEGHRMVMDTIAAAVGMPQ